MKTLDDALKALKIKIIDDDLKIKQFYDEQYGTLEGSRGDKTFYRFKSEVLQSLIAELHTNTDCGYKTYVNNVIKEGFIPKHISCMVKQVRYFNLYGTNQQIKNENFSDEVYAYKETLASQILNYYGCPTVYNLLLKTKDFRGEDEYKVISADFMQEGQTFLTFAEYDCSLSTLKESIKNIKEKILKKIKTIDESEKKKFIEDFVLSYLVRIYILMDFDFSNSNIGVLIDTDNRKLSPINFDFEQSFYEADPSISEIVEILEYVKTTYPKIYNKFVELTHTLNQALLTISTKRPTYDIESAKDYVYRNLKENVCKVDKAINEMNDLPNQ